jgi:hypothetical protein
MSEPRLEDDTALGRDDEFCEDCECLMNECACGQADTMEEARFEK